MVVFYFIFSMWHGPSLTIFMGRIFFKVLCLIIIKYVFFVFFFFKKLSNHLKIRIVLRNRKKLLLVQIYYTRRGNTFCL